MTMNLTKLKAALQLATGADNVRQRRKAHFQLNFDSNADDAAVNKDLLDSVFSVDIETVCASANILWEWDDSTDQAVVAASDWPASALAASDLGQLLMCAGSRGSYRHKNPHNNEKQCYDEQYLRDEEVILEVLLKAGLAQRFVELLLVPFDSTQAHADNATWDRIDKHRAWYEPEELLDITHSQAVQFSVCKVGF